MADPGGKYTAFGVGYAEEKSTSPSLDADGEFLLRSLRKERITDQILFENNQLEYENSSETVSLSEGLNFSDPAVAALGPSHPLPSHSHSWVPVRTSSNPSNPNNTSNQTHLQGPVKEEFEKPFFLFQHHSANGVVPSQVSMPLAFQPPVNMGIDSQMGPWISPVFPNYVPNFNFGSFPEPVGHALPNDKSGSPFGSLGYPQQVAKFDSIGVPYQDNCGIRPNGMQNTSYKENNGQVESRYANVPASGSASTVPCHRENRRKDRQGKGAWKGNVDDKNEVKGTVRLLRRSTSQQQGGNVESFKHRVDNSESQLGPTNLRNSQVYVPVNLSKSQHEHDSRQKLGRFKDDGSGSHLLLTNELQALRLNNMENDFSYSGTSSNNSQYSTVSSSPLQIRKNSRLRPSIPLEVNQFERNKHNRKVRGFVERRRQGHQRDELSGNNPQASNEDRDNSPDNQLFHTDLGHSHARSTEESDSEAAEELALNQSQNTQNEDQIHKLQVRRVRMKEFQSFMGQNPHQILKEMKFVEFKYRDDLEVFTSRFLSIYESLIPATDEEEKRKQLLFCLEKVIHRVWPGSQLHLFGSCANAFGVSKSDIDICLSINEEEINKPKLVAELAEILKAEGMQNVQALTRARVPIVKLTDPLTGISCDICINNILAVENTKLLHDYAQIDIRLQQLAFVVKHWAKCRQVNETYQGTLSSYAYVLMCIHFLQQRKPAILPCLQRMKATYHVTVGGVECSYYDQVENLKSFGAQNSETLGQLLSAFFDYWAFRHDYANSVISVRTGGTISKRIKKWTRRIGNERHLICIEDPFETDHDLGRVVDKYSIRVLKDEFQRAAIIMQHDADPSVTLFKPCTSRC